MSFWDGLLTAGVLIGLFLLAYSKIKNKSIPEIIREFREAGQEATIEKSEEFVYR